MLNGSREGKERWKFTCSSLLLVLYPLSHLLWFSRLFCVSAVMVHATNDPEGLKGVPKQYSALEVQ